MRESTISTATYGRTKVNVMGNRYDVSIDVFSPACSIFF